VLHLKKLSRARKLEDSVAGKDEGGSGHGWGIRESRREIRKQSLALGRDTGRRSWNSESEGNNLYK